jgi:hypothetical protein
MTRNTTSAAASSAIAIAAMTQVTTGIVMPDNVGVQSERPVKSHATATYTGRVATIAAATMLVVRANSSSRESTAVSTVTSSVASQGPLSRSS